MKKKIKKAKNQGTQIGLPKPEEYTVSPSMMYLLKLTEICLKQRWYDHPFVMSKAKIRYMPKKPRAELPGLTREVKVVGEAVWMTDKGCVKHHYSATFDMVTDSEQKLLARWYPWHTKICSCNHKGEGAVSPGFCFVSGMTCMDKKSSDEALAIVEMMKTPYRPVPDRP